YKLIVITQTLLAQNPLVVNNNGVFNTAAQCQVLGAHGLQVFGETKGTGTADFFNVRGGREIQTGFLSALTEYRMVKVNFKAHFEDFVGHEGGNLVTITDFNSAFDADKVLRYVLLCNTSRLQQECKRTEAAVHTRLFLRTQFN